MYMKTHILSALQEEFNQWGKVLAGLSEEQLTTPSVSSPLSIRDEIAHLWAWQQRSIARLEAARLNREPEFPQWPATLDPDSEDTTEHINAWIYETNRDHPWSTVHQNWRDGFLRLLEVGEAIAERDLLDSSRYAWLNGYPLAFILVASYDHHQEHLEKLLARL